MSDIEFMSGFMRALFIVLLIGLFVFMVFFVGSEVYRLHKTSQSTTSTTTSTITITTTTIQNLTKTNSSGY